MFWFSGYVEQLGIKTTISAFSGVTLDIISHYIGEPLVYSYVPTISSTTDQMGLLTRFGNVFGGIIGFSMFDYIASSEGEYLKKKYGDSYSGHGVGLLFLRGYSRRLP